MPELTGEEKRRIYEEEKARVEAGQKPAAAPPPILSKKLLVSVLFVVIVGFGGGLFAYQQYQLQGLKEKLGEAIGRDLGLTETILNIESESSKMTFAEVFGLCDKSVENRTNLIVELRGLYPEMDYQMKTKLVAYLTHENEFVRAKRDFYAMDFCSNRVRQLKASLIEKSADAEKSADEFTKAYENMAKEEAATANEARSAGLRFEPIFQKYANENQQKADRAAGRGEPRELIH